MPGKFMPWDDLYGKPITIVGQGRQAGVIEDFYYDPGTQGINALRVKAGFHDHAVLLSSSIASIDRNAVTIANEYMLIDETNAGPIYQLPLGSELIGFLVVTEKGRALGVVSNLILGIYPPVALRISTIVLDAIGRSHISAHEITSIGAGVVAVIK